MTPTLRNPVSVESKAAWVRPPWRGGGVCCWGRPHSVCFPLSREGHPPTSRFLLWGQTRTTDPKPEAGPGFEPSTRGFFSLKEQEADVIPVASPSAQHPKDGGSQTLWLLEGLQGCGGCLQGPKVWLPGGLSTPWGQTPKPAAPGPAFMGTKSHRQPSAVRTRHPHDARSMPRPLRSTTFP